MYTRERRGIFRSTEGFDTVAKSPGLDAAFIKKSLHPFCLYDAPAELVSRGEKEGPLYPDAVHLFHTESGETVLGRSIYQPVDFTGLRSAFLTHNYVIPTVRSGEIVDDYNAWLAASFADSYDPEGGAELPELAEIPMRCPSSGAAGLTSAQETLDRLGLDEHIFKQLLFAVMTASGEGRKKVYVSLSVPVEDTSRAALSLMEVLYSCLPYEYRRRLGFLTYAKEPQSRKYIHLQFVEKGSLRPHDRSIEKDFIFDLATGRIGQIDLDWSRQPYLDLAWNALQRGEKLQEFFAFADEMLSGMEGDRKASLTSYHELAVFFRIERGDDALYEDNKITVLRGLLEYLKPAGGMEARMRLNDLFLSRFDREFDLVRQGGIPDTAVAECIRDYFGLPGAGQEGKIVSYYILALHNAMTGEQREAAASFYTLIEGHTGLDAAFFGSVLNSERYSGVLFDPYIRDKFNRLPDVKSVLNLVQTWGMKFPQVLYKHSFQEMARTRLVDKLRSANQLLRAMDIVVKETGKWDAGLTELDQPFRMSGMTELLLSSAFRLLLSELDLDRLTKEQVVGTEFLRHNTTSLWVQELKDSRLSSHAAMLQAVYRLFTEPKPEADLFDGLGPMEMDRVQQVARKWLQSEIEPAQFRRIALAFFRESDAGFVEYGALLDYLRRNAGDKSDIYKFLLWSQNDPNFARPRGLVPAYGSSILAYFKRHDKNAFKSREYRREYFSKAGPSLSTVLNKAKLELASPVSRFFSRNRKMVLMSSMISVLLILVVVLALTLTGVIGQSDPVPQVPPLATDVSNNSEETIVYAEKLIKVETGKEHTRLIFPFDDLSKCGEFAPTELTLTKPGQESQNLSGLQPQSNCSTQDPVQEDSENTDTTGTNGTSDDTDNSSNADAASNTDTGNTKSENTADQEASKDAGETGEAADSVNPADSANSTDSTDSVETGETGETTNPPLEPKTSPDQYAGHVTVELDQAVPEGSIINVNGTDFKVKAWERSETSPAAQTNSGTSGNSEPSGNAGETNESGKSSE